MLIFKPVDFNQSPIIGEAIKLEIVGSGWGIFYGAPWLREESRELDLSARKFSRAVVFRKLPVSIKRPDLPSVKRRARIVKSKEIIKVILDKPKVKITLISLPEFKKYEVYINPKGVYTKLSEAIFIKSHIRSQLKFGKKTIQIFKTKNLEGGANDSLFKFGRSVNFQLKLKKSNLNLISAPKTPELVTLRNQKKF